VRVICEFEGEETGEKFIIYMAGLHGAASWYAVDLLLRFLVVRTKVLRKWGPSGDQVVFIATKNAAVNAYVCRGHAAYR
jgi:hypothetical protein